MRWLLLLIATAGLARAEGEAAGDFDYYVMALSWSPTWCALEGDRRGSPQCDDDADNGWVLHGLWPQYERGWPSYCPTDARNPTRADTAREADLFGASGNAWHQWNKHGRCTGLSSAEYYRLAREAYDSVKRPVVFRRITRAIRLPAELVEEAFLEDNPSLSADGITITCRQGRVQEARICLTRDLEPRDCGRDVSRDCTLDDALMAPIR
ncbi:ribonuclease T [Alphaproteobacteria bacterium GH1-50]|uniref:Ribonuclease T n=1 Tax=Kangsaoukella pontilimi TaxID=2691042 RepID=A0A7C9ISA4_9RHOB|nr:ribonuclease T2 [Kangsaoukella pontilimi]MXQ08446.1 ribonuclease T [Kangsaoukella pontilimi]